MSRKIALCQAQPASGDTVSSTRILIEWMEKAADAGADIALFGELFLTNYDLDNVSSLPETKDGSAAKAIAETAKRLKVAVVYGYSEEENSNYYSSLMFIDANGKCLANFRKVHVWPETELQYTPGDVPMVVDWEGLRVGLAISVDVCMSDFTATMVADGHAQMIVVGAALVDPPRYEKTPSLIVPASSLQNGCYIAYTDLAGEKFSGRSCFCDPCGDVLASTKTNDEALLLATIPLNACETVPFQYFSLRHPSEVYKIPYDTEVPWEKEKVDDVQHFFKNRAHYYDVQLDGIYNGPSIAARNLAAFITNKDKKILDIAAGTGLVGKELSSEGFTNIVALDRSKEMLKQSAAKKVYSQLINGSFEVAAKDIPDESFHACICVGAFLTVGFLDPAVSIVEMIRLVERGGYILLFVNSTELQEPQCKSVLESLENICLSVVEKGVCECVQKSTVPKYLDDCEGLMWILVRN